MVRTSLSGATWEFREAGTSAPWRKAVVPGCVHRDLLRHGLIPDPLVGTNELAVQWIEERDWEYRCSWVLEPDRLEQEVVDLVADGLDAVATVTLNGRRIATTENMFIGYRWNVKRWLRPGTNQLVIRFGSAMRYIRANRKDHSPREINDPVGGCTRIRKQQCQFGWDWGPRLVTAGIWRDLGLEGWSGNRLQSVRVTQRQGPKGSVVLQLAPELARAGRVRLRYQCGEEAGEGDTVTVRSPRLWWPNGQGEANLYPLRVEAVDSSGNDFGSWTRRIGLRTLALDRSADRWGESFRFVVNGRPIFAKGANWIPAHAWVAGLGRSDYERDLRAAADAHMNMIRVWGGGIYESEDFYDLCDEQGLMVWQDFMFACTPYPADARFLASVKAEADYQVRRLRHRACLALWCGNNEVYSCNPADMTETRKAYPEYVSLFHRTLPAVVKAADPATAYWPSSPWRGDRDVTHAAGEMRGDTHFWDVWHARHPVSDYRKWRFRFVSEFGMQSFASAAASAEFVPPGQSGNVFGPALENHQKNRAGNQIILDYVSRRYRFPRSQEALITLSQINQAECMQMGVDHYRRLMPRTMGALYWQLNDCWPAASWSSIEFSGRWRALHYYARRFFAPARATALMPGEETVKVGNYRQRAEPRVEFWTVCDRPEPLRATLRWELWHLDGRRLERRARPVVLKFGSSRRWETVDLRKAAEKHGQDALYVRVMLEAAGETLSDETLLLAPPRFAELPRGRTAVTVKRGGEIEAVITFRSSVYQHRFSFQCGDGREGVSDNYFDLHPGEPKSVIVRTSGGLKQLRAGLRFQSLVDTY